MRTLHGWAVLLFVAAISGLAASPAHAQLSLGALEAPYTQNFDSLANTGTSSTLPIGWALFEQGGDALYTAGTGSAAGADTYSFGAAGSMERAFGTVRTNATAVAIGLQLTNATGASIGSMSVGYHGEQWRLGAAMRADRLDFQYSLNATSVGDAAATWVDVDTLDFTAPDQAGAVGARVGNDAMHQVAVAGTVSFATAIASGATFWIRWNDFNATGNDDGLGVDDFTLTPHAPIPPPVVALVKSVVAPSPAGPTSILDYTVQATVSPGQGIQNAVLTDTLPAGVTVSGTTFSLTSSVGGPVTLTVAADADAGEVVGGVVTVRLPSLPVGGTASVTFHVVVSPRAASGTISNSASLVCDGATSGTGITFTSNTTTTNVVACVPTASGTIPLCVGSVAFDVYFDANGNGMHDTGEVGLSGWGVALDGGASQTTNATGSTTFANVTSAGSHTVSNTPPAAAGTWTAPFPATVTTMTGMTITYHVGVTCTCPDDGNLCTTIPVCNAGACGAATPIDCADTNPCTTDSCAAGTCVHAPNTLTCDDGSMTTRNDVCGGGTCAGTPYTCAPGTCEATSVANGVDCTVTYSSATTSCGAAGGCDHCSGTSGVCVAVACMVDGGTDAGLDAAVVADAGVDAAVDAAAADDAGTDAGAAIDANLGDTGASDAGHDGGASDGSTMLDGAARPDTGTVTPRSTGGCGCRASGGEAPSALWLGVVGLVILGRRRRFRR